MANTTKHEPRPDHAFIGNHTYAIEWLSVEEWSRRDMPGDKDGLTYSDRSLILMRGVPDRPESLYQEVLLHELTHAIWDTVGLSLMEDWHKDESQHDVEEKVILFQSPMMLFVLKHNPHIIAWLLSDGQVRR